MYINTRKKKKNINSTITPINSKNIRKQNNNKHYYQGIFLKDMKTLGENNEDDENKKIHKLAFKLTKLIKNKVKIKNILTNEENLRIELYNILKKYV